MYKNVRQKVKHKNRGSFRGREENESFLKKEKENERKIWKKITYVNFIMSKARRRKIQIKRKSVSRQIIMIKLQSREGNNKIPREVNIKKPHGNRGISI